MTRLLAFLLTLLLAGCGASSGQLRAGVVELVAADHGRPVSLKVGQVLSVRLDANRTTGYTWLLPNQTPANGVLLAVQPESRYEAKIDGIYSVGVGAIEVWEFKAVRAGEGVLSLEYRRPFEPGVKALRTVDFPVRVTAP